MKIKEKVSGAWRRVRGSVSADKSRATGAEKRRTVALPSILNTYSPRVEALPKATPANLRRFAETPVARKAINTIKDRIAGMKWRVQPRRGRSLADLPNGEARVQALTASFDHPNPDDSFRS